MKLWQAQQVLCRYSPKAVVYVKTPDGRFVVLDHLEDHYYQDKDRVCTCDFNRRDPEYDPECSKHGEGRRVQCPAFVTSEEHSPEVFHQAEEAECAHTVLDDMGIPREEENPREEGEMYSLVGRITAALEKARNPVEFEYRTVQRKCEQEGVERAMQPKPPPTPGWELVSATCTGTSFWYFWRRALP